MADNNNNNGNTNNANAGGDAGAGGEEHPRVQEALEHNAALPSQTFTPFNGAPWMATVQEQIAEAEETAKKEKEDKKKVVPGDILPDPAQPAPGTEANEAQLSLLGLLAAEGNISLAGAVTLGTAALDLSLHYEFGMMCSPGGQFELTAAAGDPALPGVAAGSPALPGAAATQTNPAMVSAASAGFMTTNPQEAMLLREVIEDVNPHLRA